jgi:branched-chain amino acid transport system substrate-binding protein
VERRSSATRTARRLALALLLTLATTACSGSDPTPAGGQDRPAAQVDESLGVLRVAPGSPIRIGVVLDVTNDDEELSAILAAGFATALEDFGAVQQGFRAQLDEPVDSACDGSAAQRVGESLAQDQALAAVLGPQCDASLIGLQRPLAHAGLLVVASRPGGTSLTAGPTGAAAEDRAAGTWRTSPSLLDEARAAATYAYEELGRTRAATFHDGGAESAALVTAFKDRFESLGGTVVVARTVDPSIGADVPGQDVDDASSADSESAAALDVLLDGVADAEPDVAFLPLGPAQLLVLADDWDGRSRLRAAVRLTTSRAATPDFLGDPASEGHRIVTPILEFPDAISAVTGMTASQVLERVTARSGVGAPIGWWAYAYDATTLLLRALEDASIIDVDGSLVISRSELRETISRLSFEGITGTVACDALGDCGAGRFGIAAHDDASISELSGIPIVWSSDGVG